MPQSTYNLDQTPAIIGQVVDRRRMSGRFECSEDIPFGRVVELFTDGKWRLPQGTALGKVRGVAPYNPSYLPGLTAAAGVYKSGDSFAVLREGTIWIEQDGGGSPTAATGAMNVRGASTNGNSEAVHRGKLTLTAASATVGSEIYACPGTEFVKEDSGAAMALCNVNFAANSVG